MREKYLLNYPVARQFCPPVESYWEDVSNTIQNIRGRMIRHPLGGGYGLPVVDMVGDKHLLHLGADVSWHRPVAVYAIGDGVVRISTGGPLPGVAQNRKPNEKDEASLRSPEALLDKPAVAPAEKPAAPEKNKSSGPPRAPMGWGNLIVIEHKLPDGNYITSIYGHLANRRLVSVGDVVQAGQVIGTVAKSKLENGGFDPHLHFAIRDGRMFEPGRELFDVSMNGKQSEVKLVDFNETEAEIELPEGAAEFANWTAWQRHDHHHARRQTRYAVRGIDPFASARVSHHRLRFDDGWFSRPNIVLARISRRHAASALSEIPAANRRSEG